MMEHRPGFYDHPSLISLTNLCAAAGLSSEAVEKALLEKRYFAVELDGHRYLPDFYLEKQYDRRRLESICKVLGDLPGGIKLQFFLTPKGSLSGQTPLEALAARKFAAVRCTAQGFFER